VARTPTSPAARLKVLERAKVRAAQCKRGETLAGNMMARMLETSWPTLQAWCAELDGFAESGAFEGGGNGVPYTFHPKATVAFLIKHFKAQDRDRIRQARRVRKLVGGDDLADVPEDYTLDDLSKIIRTASQLREERERQGRLTDAAAVSQALREMFSRMQQAGTRAAQQQDPTGQWPPEIRESFENAVSSIMHAMEVAARDVLSARRGAAA